MVGAEESQKARRVDIEINGGGVGAVGDIVDAEPGGPAVALEIELAFHGHVQGEEIGEPELTRWVDDAAELIHGQEREAGMPDAGVGQIELLESPEQRRRTP